MADFDKNDPYLQQAKKHEQQIYKAASGNIGAARRWMHEIVGELWTINENLCWKNFDDPDEFSAAVWLILLDYSEHIYQTQGLSMSEWMVMTDPEEFAHALFDKMCDKQFLNKYVERVNAIMHNGVYWYHQASEAFGPDAQQTLID